jgi:hypothetical protein
VRKAPHPCHYTVLLNIENISTERQKVIKISKLRVGIRYQCRNTRHIKKQDNMITQKLDNTVTKVKCMKSQILENYYKSDQHELNRT